MWKIDEGEHVLQLHKQCRKPNLLGFMCWLLERIGGETDQAEGETRHDGRETKQVGGETDQARDETGDES